MTRYAIDHIVALRILDDGRAVPGKHALVGPAVLRSHVLALVYDDVRAGRREDAVARRILEDLASLKIRLLGDRVSRATAFRLARDLDADDSVRMEYLAVAVLQADALVSEDPDLVRAAQGRIPVARYDDLFG